MTDAALIVLGLFSAVFIHEGAHYVAARLVGWNVLLVGVGAAQLFGFVDRHGTHWQWGLLPLGGRCEFGASPRYSVDLPRSQFRRSAMGALAVTAAGPIASLLFAALMYLAAGIGDWDQPNLLRDQGIVALAISYFSLFIGLFNLMPVPPLDGGRIWLLAVELLRGTPVSATFRHRSDVAGKVVITVATLIAVAILMSALLAR